ncbi:MAG: hypothetical protein E7612_03815 [Ruminococcaceae bacterium]|nr:hypothetical protein [Oscillospiraceae bacterium]
MKRYITVDCGTTNTRVFLVEVDKIVSHSSLSVGAKNCFEDRTSFTAVLKAEIDSLIKKNLLFEKDIEAIILSGMITSELGLCTVEHIKAPAGKAELNKGLVLRDVGISSLPCYFIPGVKTNAATLDATDMMRGEEAELMGLIRKGDGECVYVLPGSHSKHIIVDSEGRISDFGTFLSGELIAALANHTILKDSVSLDIESFDEEYLLTGYDYAKKYGISATLFKTRIANRLFGLNPIQCYSFFMGAVLENEISAVTKYGKKKIMIGGKASLREPMRFIIENRTELEVGTYSDDETKFATALGAVKIFTFKGE